MTDRGGNPATTITFQPPARLLNMNDRGHWAPRARLTRLWRERAYYATIEQIPAPRALPPCVVAIDLPVRDRRRRDPANLTPVTKACVDGITDAGVWPDDSGEWVATTEPRLIVGGTLVTITLTPRETAA